MKETTPTIILAATILIGSLAMSTGMIIAAEKIKFSVRTPDDLNITLCQSKQSDPLRLRLDDEDDTLNVRLWPPTKTEQENYWVSNDQGEFKSVRDVQKPTPFPIEIPTQIGAQIKVKEFPFTQLELFSGRIPNSFHTALQVDVQ